MNNTKNITECQVETSGKISGIPIPAGATFERIDSKNSQIVWAGSRKPTRWQRSGSYRACMDVLQSVVHGWDGCQEMELPPLKKPSAMCDEYLKVLFVVARKSQPPAPEPPASAKAPEPVLSNDTSAEPIPPPAPTPARFRGNRLTLDETSQFITNETGAEGNKKGICPSCGGSSFTNRRGDGGTILLKCFSGDCEFLAMVQAIGLEHTGTFSSNNSNGKLIPSAEKSTGRNKKPKAKKKWVEPDHIYSYKRDGKLLFQQCRWDAKAATEIAEATKKSFAQRYADPENKDRWIYKQPKGAMRIVFQFDLIKACLGDQTIFVVEGEKCVLALAAKGLLATCSLNGAGNAEAAIKNCLPVFKGKRFCILPDNDSNGKVYSDTWTAGLWGTAKSIKAVELPGLNEKDDVVEWIAAGGTAAELLALVDAAPLWAPPKAEPWPEPQSLPPVFDPVPTITPEMIPEPLRDWLVDCAKRLSVPLEFIAVPAVVSLAAIAGSAIQMQPKKYDYSWRIIPNLWGAIVGRPGLMKSPAVKAALKAIKRMEAAARAEAEKNRGAILSDKSILETRLKMVKRDIEKNIKSGTENSPDFEIAVDKQEKILEEMAEGSPPARRHIVNDATIESLGELLNDNPRGLLLQRDELTGFFQKMDRPGHEDDRPFYLECWTGGGTLSCDRINQNRNHAGENLTLSIIGTIQPGKLKKYINGAIEGMDDADGFIQRFQLFVWPDALENWKNIDEYPDKEAEQKADDIFYKIEHLDAADVGARSDMFITNVHYMNFEPDAQACFNRWLETHVNKILKPPISDSPAFAGHLDKYRSLIPSLALLFHLVNVVDAGGGTHSGGVSLDALKMAIEWGEFLKQHAKKIYASELKKEKTAARLLAEKIKAGAVPDGITIRDIKERDWSGLTDPAVVDAALLELENLGWVRVEKQATGGRPTEKIRISPKSISK